MPRRSKQLITVIGLGPGDAALLTVEARDALAAAPEVWLRTAHHPTTAGLPAGPRYEAFDDLYDTLESFEAVYDAIAARLLELARDRAGVVYAVPGHPMVGEATVRRLLRRAEDERLAVRIISGVSFVDAAATALGVDPLADGLLVLDALEVDERRRLLVPQRPTLIAQVFDRRTATRAKLALLESYPPDHAVRIVSAAGTADARVSERTLAELDRTDDFDHLTTVFVPPLTRIEDVRSFEGVRAIVARLRAPEGGCPWDLEQTHETLKRYLLEESYEALDALDEGNAPRIAEELGDLLMQIVLHAQVAEDERKFTIEDVFASIGTKLVRRHPHVFADVVVTGAGDVVQNWETLKQEERGDQPLLDAVPKAMPALAQAQAVHSRATKAGVAPELPPAAAVLSMDQVTFTADAVGDLLFSIVTQAHEHGIDAEEALRLAVRRYRDAVAEAERRR